LAILERALSFKAQVLGSINSDNIIFSCVLSGQNISSNCFNQSILFFAILSTAALISFTTACPFVVVCAAKFVASSILDLTLSISSTVDLADKVSSKEFRASLIAFLSLTDHILVFAKSNVPSGNTCIHLFARASFAFANTSDLSRSITCFLITSYSFHRSDISPFLACISHNTLHHRSCLACSIHSSSSLSNISVFLAITSIVSGDNHVDCAVINLASSQVFQGTFTAHTDLPTAQTPFLTCHAVFAAAQTTGLTHLTQIASLQDITLSLTSGGNLLNLSNNICHVSDSTKSCTTGCISGSKNHIHNQAIHQNTVSNVHAERSLNHLPNCSIRFTASLSHA
jgi:hypothetical protein